MRFWVDVDNAPHVLVVTPLVRELQARGHEVEITARDYGQTLPLLKLRGLTYVQIGRHSGKRLVGKCLAFLWRSLCMVRFALGRRFDAIICHGSRGVFVPARLLSIPLVVLGDYEYGALPGFMARWMTSLLVPDVMPKEVAAGDSFSPDKVVGYPGLKEDLYIHELEPDPAPLVEMGIDLSRPVVLVRPPATMAHYYVKESGTIFAQVLSFLCSHTEVQVVLLPRTDEQKHDIEKDLRARGCANIRIPDRVSDGPNLVWHSDLVISGGGTMNREAATLNVPVYSIYQGPLGSVDKHLAATGRLKMLSRPEQIQELPLTKDYSGARRLGREAQNKVLDFVVEHIVQAVTSGRRR